MTALRHTSIVRIARLTILCALLPIGAASAQPGQKRPLDHSVYDDWKAIEGQSISADGRWVLYNVVPRDGGDGELIVREAEGEREHIFPRGSSARFDSGSNWVVFLIEPSEEAMKEAREAEMKPDELPKSALGILRLADGSLTTIDGVRSFRLPEEAGDRVVFLMERDPPAEAEEAETEHAVAEEQEAESTARKPSELGTRLVVRRLDTGTEQTWESATAYALSADGNRLYFVGSEPDKNNDGVHVADTNSGSRTPLLTGAGRYLRLTLDEEGRQAAFLSDRDDQEAESPAVRLYHWQEGMREAAAVASEEDAGIPTGWWVSEHRTPSFSENGSRIFFGTAPRPEPEPEEDEEPGGESQVKLDIWHWQDPYLQPQQLIQADQERRRSFQAVVHLSTGDVVQLARKDMPSVTVGAEGNAENALAVTNVRYRKRSSWDTPGWSDIHLVNVYTGERQPLMEEVRINADLSPDGRYLTWWDYQEHAWFAMSVESNTMVELSAGIPYPVWNELHDTPSLPPAYGSAGFTEGDEFFLIYDRYDIWAADPSGRTETRCITEGSGRDRNMRFRYAQLDPEERQIDPGARIVLSAFDMTSRASGFYRDRVRGSGLPQQLLMTDYRFSDPTRAADADRLLFTRESFQEFPDLWVSDSRFGGMTKISEANPQMGEFLWGTAEIVTWESVDGTTLAGILYKPQDFDPTREYPLMVTFYERSSDNLHRHWAPEPHRSIINYTFYTSRGYLVFLPDIPYRTGYPGESALNAVVPGVLDLIKTGYVDRDNIGVAGHSWGGYQIAFMITRTNLFKAAEAGAPVSNMTSAYGGIRWASGMSRMFQYEHTQSRIGATLWEAPLKYIENSPVFWADKIETPLLIMHNDEDGAVPWEQGIELFVALRRLEKPAWMIVYNEQPHWPITWPNKKDWAIRLQQYFDHFLKGAPAPVWIAEGIPAVRKGKTLGREPAMPTVIPPVIPPER
jgi:dipeptidyl aminopeptidase/acylaminoacyl peptidase